MWSCVLYTCTNSIVSTLSSILFVLLDEVRMIIRKCLEIHFVSCKLKSVHLMVVYYLESIEKQSIVVYTEWNRSNIQMCTFFVILCYRRSRRLVCWTIGVEFVMSIRCMKKIHQVLRGISYLLSWMSFRIRKNEIIDLYNSKILGKLLD